MPGLGSWAVANPVDVHLNRFPPEQRAALEQVRRTIRAALPLAEEGLAYRMPTFRIEGIAVVSYDGFTKHNSLFPMSGSVTERMADELTGFEMTKGSIHFPLDTPFPTRLLRRVIGIRIDDINASFPRKSGEMKRFFANGVLREHGRMRGGVKVGKWTTYDRGGRAVKVTDFGR